MKIKWIRLMYHDPYLKMAHDIVIRHVQGMNVSVFLFGSRARGDRSRAADVDIGFLSDTRMDTRLLRRIADDIEESRIPYHIDLIDFSRAEPGFKKEAMKKVVWWKKAD